MERQNEELIKLYMEAAQESLKGAEFNLDGDYTGIAINRAYYAFFYAASALLLTKDIARSKHSGVLAAFHQHFVKSGVIEAEHSDAYGVAKKMRQSADYDLLDTTEEADARASLAQAKQFVARIKHYLREAGYP